MVLYLDIDEVAVPTALWGRVTDNDTRARSDLRNVLHGMTVYEHSMALDAATHVVVRTRELSRLGLLDTVVLQAPPRS